MLEKIDLVKQVEKKIKNNDYKGALGDITRCLELYPNFIVAKVLKAECLLNLNNAEEALALANEVLFSSPDNIKARKIAIEANLRVGNVEEAKSHVDFLGFLLPANHPYLDEIKKKINEQEKLSQVDNDETFEIERTELTNDKDEQPDEVIENVDQELKEEDYPVEKTKEISEDERIETDRDEDELVKDSEEKEDDFLIESQDIEEEIGDEYSSGEQVDEIKKEEVVTGVLPDQISTVTLPDKKEEPEIKTRTLALIYERQGMFEEALEILENLFDETQDIELLKDIERIKTKLKGGDKNEFVIKKIKILENWLERVKWHSSN
ncbi:hypothetical protein TTHT_0232 [Thermotomaculum hydrothermale]|uniref:Tetratricopeptide repeat protein n=1 Tax=Thermotomaculum hydrothermale TaxID=981385 RepID=A0A7R6PP91_9BACT|nr:tetratricopeptide repeat protein [Thermotomaculum hydrothermale]BBB31856.1 hypothetical protein TTHT_0232 [Thermotomaculum hydrothermale]